MTKLQYATPVIAAQWGISRETHVAVAMAIHAISDANRSPEGIWCAPSKNEWDHVAMAVENYIDNGVFPAEADGRYPWGEECIVIIKATTYTVTSSEGEYPRRGLTLAEAANEILSTDSREWEIRSNDGVWEVWSRQQVANRGWSKTVIYSVEDSREVAETEMFQAVIDQSWDWPGHDYARTDGEHDRLQTESADFEGDD